MHDTLRNRYRTAFHTLRTTCKPIAWLLASGIWLSCSWPAHADAVSCPVFVNARVVLGPPTIKVHAAYFDVKNGSSKKFSIVGASSESYERVELHQSKVIDGVAMMESVSTAPVEAGKSLAFSPGGLHLMLIRPLRALTPGERIFVSLNLDDGRQIPISLLVTARTTAAAQTTGHKTTGPAAHANHKH